MKKTRTFSIGKILRMVALLTVPSMAWACPNLAGIYICSYKAFRADVTIAQTMVSGGTVYQFGFFNDPGEIIADGLTHVVDSIFGPLDFVLRARNYDYTATCYGEEVAMEGTADFRNSQDRGTLKGQLLLKGNEIEIHLTLKAPGKENIVSVTCMRK